MQNKVFSLSGKDKKQVSYASQAWMVLSGVATKAEGAKAIQGVAFKNQM